MTYLPSSPYTGYVPPVAAWRGVLTQHGAVGGADAILASYTRWCQAYHLDANLALAQACLEATYFTSTRWVNEWNPAGLGITSGTTPPNPFASLDDGIRAHCEHVCCYVYTLADCPADHAHLADRRHAFHDGITALSGLERPGVRQWAVPGTNYIADILTIVNSVVTTPPPQPGGTPVRIIVHAGHQNIGNITSDPNGVIDAAALRGGTGANGEMQWNVACATELTRLLRAAGADAVQTDAIYHADVYGPDADLVFAIHYDGGGGTGHAQYCMAAAVHSGPSTTAADSLADAIVQEWYASYPAAMGIAGNGPITVDMQQYYGGWYRSANTPMLLAEHCLGADAAGIRSDRPLATVAAAADFAVLAKHFGLGSSPQPGPDPYLHLNGHLVGGAFRRLFESTPYSLQAFGLPTTDELTTAVTDPAADGVDAHAVTRQRTVQYFERAIMVYFPELPVPWDVSCVPLTSIVGE